MSDSKPQVIYSVPDKMGGMLNIVVNLLAYRTPGRFDQRIILVDNPLTDDTRFNQPMSCDRQDRFEHCLPLENLYSVLRRLSRLIPQGPGVLVSNDWIELALLYAYDPGKAVVQILHGDHDYYYDLAQRHESVVDAYVAYSRTMYETLMERLPHRADTIFHMPYGIPISSKARQPKEGPLRLIFAGRLEQGQKQVLMLPEIDRGLKERGIEVVWTLVGDGPQREELLARWEGPPRVNWLGLKTNAEVMEIFAHQDIFVLPSRAEGFPVALLEGMSVGLVPVVSDLASGVPEVVTRGENGLLPPVGDAAAFAEAIASLDADRQRLNAISRLNRAMVKERYDVRDRASDYEALYERWQALYRPKAIPGPMPYGSRLDQPWIPNPLVSGLRRSQRWLRRRNA